MKKIKEIIVYTNGDSNDISTWSNVPYFFTNELEKRKIRVDRVNIAFNKNSNVIAKLFYYLIKIIRALIELVTHSKSKYKFQYTNYYRKHIQKIMKESVIKYKNADLQLMFGFSYSIESNIPLFMFSDWTIDYRLNNRQNRKPSNLEQKIISDQYESMSKAAAIVSILPNSANEIKKHIDNNVYYLGTGINSLIEYKKNNNKFESKEILFSGRKKEYLNGLLKLIEVVNYLNDNHNRNYMINVIGMNKEDLENINSNCCNFYGYLKKDDKEQFNKYYELISNSKLLINVNPGWNGISTLLEVLYLGTPIIISKNKEVNSVIGEGNYCTYVKDELSVDELAILVDEKMQMNKEEYEIASIEAHDSTKDQEWNTIVERFIKISEDLL